MTCHELDKAGEAAELSGAADDCETGEFIVGVGDLGQKFKFQDQSKAR